MALIEVQNMSFEPILNNICLSVSSGQMIVLLGKNGSGKTTLLRCISGWNKPTNGAVVVEGHPLPQLSPSERAKYISALPQRLSIYENIPVQDWIAFGRFRFNESHTQSIQYAQRLLSEHHMSDFALQSMATLSGGEAQRIGLISMMGQESQIWLLDEPANHLDPRVQFEVYEQLVRAWTSGQTMVLTTHNINLLAQSVPIEKHHQISIVAIANGAILWQTNLASPDICTGLSNLYECTVAWQQGHLVFSRPSTEANHDA